MRQVIDGAGNDSTAATLTWLKGGNEFRLATLYLIGEPDDPYALWLTDWESPLLWAPWGTFLPAVVRRGQVQAEIGLQVSALDVEWSPLNTTAGISIPTSSPYQLARVGFYDNWTFRSWTVFMPTGTVSIYKVDAPAGVLRYWYTSDPGTPALRAGMLLRVTRMPHQGNNGTFRLGAVNLTNKTFFVTNPGAFVATEAGQGEILSGDAASFGAAELFGGRIGKCSIERGLIKFTVNSFLDVLNQQVPLNIIERLNTMAAFMGAKPPAGLSVVPQFNAIRAVDTAVVGDCTSPSAHQIFSAGAFKNGYLVFNDRPGSSLGRMWSAVLSSKEVIIAGVHYNQFNLFTPLPYEMTGTDTFYVTGTPPMNKADGEYVGFLYVPSPELSV